MDYELDNAYRNSHWVLSGKIKSISIDEKDKDLRKISMETIEQFKGSSIQHFFIFDPFKDPCSVSIREGESFLLYLQRDEKGRAWLGGCHRHFPINYIKSQSIELEILREIKKSEMVYTSSFMVEGRSNTVFLSGIFGFKSNPSIPPFGVFEIEYHALLGRSRVKVIRSFGKNLDIALIDLIENSPWEFYNPYRVPISHPAKFFLVLESDYNPILDSYSISRYNFY